MQYVFITGLYRSGTTLAEKILTNHNSGYIASQPFPMLYVGLKRFFDQQEGIPSNPYHINPNFPSNYAPSTLDIFLKKFLISKTHISDFINEMRGYSGCQTPELFNQVIHLSENFLDGLYFQMCNTLIENPSSKTKFIGSKEIICEEFIHYYLQNNIKVILVIRDPRDIIASTNFSQTKLYTGKKRPLIYTLRMWRKSVAYAINFNKNPNLFVIKYEDLVGNPLKALTTLTKFLNVAPYPSSILNSNLKNQEGATWAGNSSYGDKKAIDKSSIGKYKGLLSKTLVALIETTCRAEMDYFEYETTSTFNPEYLDSYSENKGDLHAAFNNFVYDLDKIKSEELSRIKAFTTNEITRDKIRKLFLFENVYHILKNAKKE